MSMISQIWKMINKNLIYLKKMKKFKIKLKERKFMNLIKRDKKIFLGFQFLIIQMRLILT